MQAAEVRSLGKARLPALRCVANRQELLWAVLPALLAVLPVEFGQR